MASPAEERLFRNCPRCRTGTDRDAVICGSCGAVLRSIAAVHDIVESVICGSCGAANAPHDNECRSCGAVLLQTCPHCDWMFAIGAAACPRCGLERRDFYAESARVAYRMEQARRRDALAGRMVFLASAALSLLIALWQHEQGVSSLRNVAIVFGLLFLAIWTLLRVVR